MNIDFREFLREPIWLLAIIVGLICVKAAILLALGRLFRFSWSASIETGLLLGPGGEFTFIIIGLAANAGLVEPHTSSFIFAATSVTMILTPLLATIIRKLLLGIAPTKAIDAEQPPAGQAYALVVGYGRIGKVVCSLLQQHGVPYIAVDNDASGVARARRAGDLVYYGNASDLRFLEKCGLQKATGVVITIQSKQDIDSVVKGVREIRPDVLIVSRARDADHACHLYAIGATDVIPETIEASLQLSEAALVRLGVAAGLAIDSVHEKRDEFRRALQQAAPAVLREDVYAARRKCSGQNWHRNPGGGMRPCGWTDWWRGFASLRGFRRMKP